MLVQWGQQQAPITRIWAPAELVARDQNRSTILPAPVDYVSWTPRVAGFLTDPNLVAQQNRVLLLNGRMTPLAQQQMTANGWNVRQGQ
jgi:hypothetical protein